MSSPDRTQFDAQAMKMAKMINSLDIVARCVKEVRDDLAEKLADYLEAKTKGAT